MSPRITAQQFTNLRARRTRSHGGASSGCPVSCRTPRPRAPRMSPSCRRDSARRASRCRSPTGFRARRRRAALFPRVPTGSRWERLTEEQRTAIAAIAGNDTDKQIATLTVVAPTWGQP